ncbi:GNAT family N-acetyltransferase [Terrabacter sp. BE26]|uniref:GNAT family N-acetyltransferase n=1 Tax=Terrabacter sp. BE26 TaxID=2898152 RepID=UPI0035BE9FD6
MPSAYVAPVLVYNRSHLDEVVALCSEEGWTDYVKDPERTHRVLTAPGVISLVALDQGKAAVVGFIQLQGDGELQAHVSLLLVKPQYRLRGVARLLLGRALRDSGCVRADVFVEGDDATAFYRRMPHKEGKGFRLQPFET